MNNIRIHDQLGVKIDFESSKLFGGGERHIQLKDDFKPESVSITFFYDGDQSILDLLMTVDALKRMGAQLNKLFIPYFPGARQDRVCNYGEAFSLKVYAELINGLKFKKVEVFDPHSDVTLALLDNCQAITNYTFIEKVITEKINSEGKPLVLVSPDAGANKKVFGLAKYFNGAYEVARADKIRDVKSGRIVDTQVFCDSLAGKIALIVDDIVSYANTFMKLAEKLREKGADKIYLAASHNEGIYSEDALRKSGIDGVFCTNSFLDRITKTQFTKVIDLF